MSLVGSPPLSHDTRGGWAGEAGEDFDDVDRKLRLLDLAKWGLCFLVAAVALLNTVDLNTGGSETEKKVGLDGVVAIKLLFAAAVSAVGAVSIAVSPRVRACLVSPPGFVMTLLGLVFLATSLLSLAEVRTVCIAAAIIYCVYLVFTVASVSLLGWSLWTRCLLIGLVVNMLANWAVYLIAPDFATYEEWLPGDTIFRRMGGLGHPNSIGRIAVMAVLIGLAKFRHENVAINRGDSLRRVDRGYRTVGQYASVLAVAGLVLLSLATIYASYSRTALVAGVAGAAMLWSDRWFSRSVLASVLLLGAVALLTLGATGLVTGEDIGGDVIGSLTKTGQASELTTATGRTRIWAKATELIAQRPITGYGLNSAPVLLKDYSLHTHNLLLHVTFSGGVIAGALTLFLLFWNVVFGLTDSAPMVRAVSGYLIVSGMFEDTVLDTFSGPSTLLWLAVMMVPTLRSLGDAPDGG